MGIDYSTIRKDVENHELKSSLMAQMKVMQMTGKKLVEEYREQVANTLLTASITLIPSDHLQDHQFVVSRGVYNAALRTINEPKGAKQ